MLLSNLADKGEKLKQGWEKASSLDLDLRKVRMWLVGGREGEKEADPWGVLQDVKRRAATGQDNTHPTLELGINFTVPWRMVDKIPIW